MSIQSEREIFAQVFETITNEVIESLRKTFSDIPEAAIDRIENMVRYNVPKGKFIRGMLVKQTFSQLAPTPTQIQLSQSDIAGWCIEWLQGFFLIQDDIMDRSETRRGQPCWYQLPQVGLAAINDGMILDSMINIILDRFFGHDDKLYLQLTRLFNDIRFKTEMGQMLDMDPPAGADRDVAFFRSFFTLEKYQKIVKYKTAYYTFYLPIAAAVYIAKLEVDMLELEKICLLIGEYFQIQDDYLDCYGNVEQTGKIGTDIEDFKCSWLAVQFVQKANGDQLAQFMAHYGNKDKESVAIVRGLFKDVQLPELFEEYESSSFTAISDRVSKLNLEGAKLVFGGLMKLLFKRSK
eukprot:TRINITY_DN1319_c1_g1_i1.p1 TRINITY_DN1319_c1_g1~~TRINITY_DN1319_c1_g1_i1.p1  ORF type:complete len:350 (+),score=136.05 TRINITY_DN1319_c1_g1_i1:101-1150(+)